MAMEGYNGVIEAQPILRIELLELLELTPHAQTSQNQRHDRLTRHFLTFNLS